MKAVRARAVDVAAQAQPHACASRHRSPALPNIPPPRLTFLSPPSRFPTRVPRRRTGPRRGNNFTRPIFPSAQKAQDGGLVTKLKSDQFLLTLDLKHNTSVTRERLQPHVRSSPDKIRTWFIAYLPYLFAWYNQHGNNSPIQNLVGSIVVPDLFEKFRIIIDSFFMYQFAYLR